MYNKFELNLSHRLRKFENVNKIHDDDNSGFSLIMLMRASVTKNKIPSCLYISHFIQQKKHLTFSFR